MKLQYFHRKLILDSISSLLQFVRFDHFRQRREKHNEIGESSLSNFQSTRVRLERANVETCLLQRALLHRRAELG